MNANASELIKEIKLKYKSMYQKMHEIEDLRKDIKSLEKNNLLSDNNYSFTKIQSLANQGKSKNFIKNYLYSKGVDKKIIINELGNYEDSNYQWEKKSAMICKQSMAPIVYHVAQ